MGCGHQGCSEIVGTKLINDESDNRKRRMRMAVTITPAITITTAQMTQMIEVWYRLVTRIQVVVEISTVE